MQIKSVINNIHYINLVTFNISTMSHKNFFLIFPAEIEQHLIHTFVLYAVKYGNKNL